VQLNLLPDLNRAPLQLGTNPPKVDRKGKGKAKADELVAPLPLGLVDGPDDDFDFDAPIPWVQPPGYIDVVTQAHSPSSR
jgi:hypothetical protein